MEKYRFYQDSKETVWHRNYFNVTAENREEALAKVKVLKDCDIANLIRDDIENTHGETLFDTAEQITPEQNGGAATLEIYDEEEELLFDNNIKL